MKSRDDKPGRGVSLVGIPEAAAALGVSPQALRQWCNQLGAPHQRRDGRAYVNVEQISRWRETYRTGHVEGAHGGGRSGSGRPPKGRRRPPREEPVPAEPSPAPIAASAPPPPPPQPQTPQQPAPENSAPPMPSLGPMSLNAAGLLAQLESGTMSLAKITATHKAVQTVLALEERERERGGLVKAGDVQAVLEMALARMRTALERIGPDLAVWAASEFRLNTAQAAAIRAQALRRVDGAIAQLLEVLGEKDANPKRKT